MYFLGDMHMVPSLFPNKDTAQMEADEACTLELELIFLLQQVSDSFWVLGSCGSIIDIYFNALVDVAIMPHPNVKFSLAWMESHAPEIVGKAFLPMEAVSPEATDCLDDKGVSFQITKFKACNDIDLFLSFHLKISIANICCPNSKIMSLAMKARRCSPWSKTTPEQTLSSGTSMRCPSGTSLLLCNPLCFTSITR